MTASTGSSERAIVPRWRPLAATFRTYELEPLKQGKSADERMLKELAEKRQEWLANQSPAFAAEVASAALVAGRNEEGVDAAEYLLASSASKLPTARRLALTVLDGDPGRVVNVPSADNLDVDASRRRVHDLRRRLGNDPRNSLGWLDLAYEYAVLGQHDHAERALSFAITVSPHSRFVIRAGSRFFVERDEPDRAHSLLLRTERTKKDPWLAAAEIAVADVAEEPARYVRAGREMAGSDNFTPSQLTELSSALGTVELKGGASRRARKWFESSLVDATENSLAQAEWASQRLSNFHLTTEDLSDPDAFEARARHQSEVGNWKEAVEEAWRWHLDQPFAADGAVFGSYSAAVGLADFVESERIASVGLISNPEDGTLINNLAYALLEQGRAEEASVWVKQLPGDADPDERVAFVATRGLLAYRQGDTEHGRELYESAIALAKRESLPYAEAMATMKLAEEELRIQSPNAMGIVARAIRLARGLKDPGVRVARERLSLRAK